MKGKKVVNATGGGRVHGERWIHGPHAVRRRLEVQPGTVLEVAILPRRTPVIATLRALAVEAGIRVREVDEATLRRLSGTGKHQGAIALTEHFHYRDIEELAVAGARPVLVLDGIQDPHNFGALIRTAVAAGMAGIVVPRHGQVDVTPAVEKAAAGAVNDLVLCRVVNIRAALERLGASGYWRVGLGLRSSHDIFATDIPTPAALVVGGESGLRPLVERSCDVCVSIPMSPVVESLNVSVAAGIAMYEVARRQPP